MIIHSTFSVVCKRNSFRKDHPFPRKENIHRVKVNILTFLGCILTPYGKAVIGIELN